MRYYFGDGAEQRQAAPAAPSLGVLDDDLPLALERGQAGPNLEGRLGPVGGGDRPRDQPTDRAGREAGDSGEEFGDGGVDAPFVLPGEVVESLRVHGKAPPMARTVESAHGCSGISLMRCGLRPSLNVFDQCRKVTARQVGFSRRRLN
ncbi:hypothetical protein ACX9GQ_03780 [Alsobacter sp. R-9]